MLKRSLKKLFNVLSRMLGYGFVKIQSIGDQARFQIYQYRQSDGTFDYEEYKRTQVKGNKRKIHIVAVSEKNVVFLSNYIRNNIDTVNFGICHGTRRGKEQEWFRKNLGCEVIDTEISDTAEHFRTGLPKGIENFIFKTSSFGQFLQEII